MIQFCIVLIWIFLIGAKGHINGTSNDTTIYQKTPLTQCCRDDEFYRPGLDRCLYRTHDLEPDSTDPVLYAVGDNDTMLVGADEFELNYYLDVCPEGFVATSTTEFQVFVDGKLLAMESLFKPDQFCISQVPTSHPTNPEFVARFCVPDPCYNQTDIKCLRKCCPPGFAIDLGSHSCQPHPSRFNVTPLIKKNGGPIDIENEESLTLHSGLGIKCRNDDFVQVEEFVVYSNGLFLDLYRDEQYVEQPTDQYCIDNFIDGNSTKLMGLKCYPEILNELPAVFENVTKAAALYPYLLFASAMLLIITFIIYAVLPNLRNRTGISIMSFVFSMAAYYIGLGLIQMMPSLPTIPKAICTLIPALVHFACLGTFSWLNVLCFDVWWSLRKPEFEDPNKLRARSNRPLVCYCIYGWSVPLLIVIAGQLIEHLKMLPEHVIKPNFDESRCWFSMKNSQSLFVYLHGPVTVMFLCNIIFFVLTSFSMCRRSAQRNESTIEKRPILGARAVICLFLMMGALWMTECVTILVKESVLTWLLNDIIHILTSVFVFVIFIFKKSVWKAFKKKCCACSDNRQREPQPTDERLAPYLENRDHGFTIDSQQRFRRSRIVDELTAGSLPSRYQANKERARFGTCRLENILKAQDDLSSSSSDYRLPD